MEAQYELTVADIVTKNIKTADVFKKYGIDFCCSGGVSVALACEKKNLDPKIIEQELALIQEPKNKELEYHSWSLEKLARHVLDSHHTYVKEATPIIKQYAEKVANVHGDHYPELVTVRDIFFRMSDELADHMVREEEVLFPFIFDLIEGSVSEKPKRIFGSVSNPISAMMSEHVIAGQDLEEIRRLTNDFKLPLDACNTFRALYAKLEEYEEDLHVHVHLENNLIFPKSEALEKASSV
jgi:regulator of cell morphogenesis and NO signaling